MESILTGICDSVPEGLVAYTENNQANRPAGLIQDQPRGLSTDFVIIDHELSLYLGGCPMHMEN